LPSRHNATERYALVLIDMGLHRYTLRSLCISMCISREGEKARGGSQSEDRGGKRRKCKDSRARWRCCLQVFWFSVEIRQFGFEGRTVSLGVLEFRFAVLKLSVEVFTSGCEVLRGVVLEP
jgi:hypothetical protein